MMWLLLLLVGAAGLALALTSIPLLRPHKLRHRIEPYLSGLHGRPSDLLVLPSSSRAAWRLSRHLSKLRGRPYDDGDLRNRLAAAGRSEGPEEFRLQQLIWALGLLSAVILFGVVALLSGAGADPRSLPLLAVVAAAGGWLGRDWWLTKEIEARRRVLAEELPIAIDLLALAIVAGESVPGACARVSSLLTGGIGAELARVVADVRAGAPAVDALESLAERLPDPSTARLVDALVTGIEKGAPLAEVLRAQADDARESRRRRLLELGGRREVLMLIPVVFLIMPVVVVFALLPGLVSLDLLVP